MTDVHELAHWVGIVHSLTELDHLKSYAAVLEDRVGPFQLRADLSISVDVLVEGSSVHVEASGRDRAVGSRIEIIGDLDVVGHPGGGSEISVSGSYEVTGKVAAMGAAVVRKRGDLAVEQFFQNLSRAFDR